jgi:hypothetical protein
MAPDPPLRCVLMRGPTACGKSTTARRIAGDAGVICETDAFFRGAGADPGAGPGYQAARRRQAQAWNLARFKAAVDAGVPLVVVDRRHATAHAASPYASYAAERGYAVELREPDSPQWAAIRPLLADPRGNAQALARWARRLAELSAAVHGIDEALICSQLLNWRLELTVADILAV